MSRPASVMMVANTAWYLANFRLRLARALLDQGYQVIAVAPGGADAARLESIGVRFVALPMDSAGTHPLRDLGLIVRLVRLLRRERPDVFLGYTVKPNVYGGIVCRLAGIPSVHNISGLGTAFINEGLLTRLVRGLYRAGLRRAARVFFQNPDDLQLFRRYRLVRPEQAERLPGSGVDTDRFVPPGAASDDAPRPFRFLLAARLLWDKGVGEFVAAARQLREEGADIECRLLGFAGARNRTAIPADEIERWQREGVVTWLGAVEDVRPVLGTADCVVLPSYREGVPRSLLEAASMARPIITTDAIGCRETVDDGVTGYLCRPRDAGDLADRMRAMLALSPAERAAMGQRGREKMLAEFDEQIVLDRYLAVVAELAA